MKAKKINIVNLVNPKDKDHWIKRMFDKIKK